MPPKQVRPRRFDIFEPAAKMPKTIKDAAIVLGAPNPPMEDVLDAFQKLRSDGLVRGKGAYLSDVCASVGALVGELYANQPNGISSEDAKMRARDRFTSYQKLTSGGGRRLPSGSTSTDGPRERVIASPSTAAGPPKPAVRRGLVRRAAYALRALF